VNTSDDSESDYGPKKDKTKIPGRGRGRPPVEPKETPKSKDTKKDDGCEVVYESGKAIGKKDAEGKFIPYKRRGRPTPTSGNAKNLGGSKASAPKPERKSGDMSIEDLLAEETIKQEKQDIDKHKKTKVVEKASQSSESEKSSLANYS